MRSSIHRVFKLTNIMLVIFLICTLISYATYKLNRPVVTNDEPINQSYLYGEGSSYHKGVDWPYADTGDPIYAVSSGILVDFKEDNADNCHPWNPPNDPELPQCNSYGNYVLLMHNNRNYDKNTNHLVMFILFIFISKKKQCIP